MAFASYDRAPSDGTSRSNASHLAWARLGVIAACVAFWIAAFAIRAVL